MQMYEMMYVYMDQTFFIHNRQALCKVAQNKVLILAANSLLQKSSDVTYDFRQDSSFWYLTGVSEPGYVLVLDTDTGHATLLTPQHASHHDLWEGAVTEKDLTAISGVTSFGATADLPKLLKKAKDRAIGYMKPSDPFVSVHGFYTNPGRQQVAEVVHAFDSDPYDARMDVARLRQIKQPEELALIQKAIDVTARSLQVVKENLNAFDNENDIERTINGHFYSQSDGHGYPPIIASGKHACTIHYTNNNAPVKQNELILLDVGAQVGYYTADITRTWAVGAPSQRQQEIHGAVADIQQYAYGLLKPGVLIKEFEQDVRAYAQKIGKKCGLDGDVNEFFPHATSHSLGLDVHDAADYSLPLAENMVITVEPGIYLPDEGIGVRLEDNIRITKDGIEIMSQNIPSQMV